MAWLKAAADEDKQNDELYFQSMVKLALVHRVEVGQPSAFEKPRTVEEALDELEQKIGPQGRREFEKFLRKMEHLETEDNGEEVDDEDIIDSAVPRPTRPPGRRT